MILMKSGQQVHGKTRTIGKRVQVDEGVNMEDMVENLFQQPL
jgi:hypothetical protein